jgi:glycosidase
LNLLGSHDTPRIATLLRKDQSRLALAEVLQFTLPGTPMIYYGDEIGMEGGKDPDCRRCYPVDPQAGDREQRRRLAHLIGLRKKLEPLVCGDFHPLYAEGDALAFERRVPGQGVLVAVNAGSEPARIPGLEGQDLLSGRPLSGILPAWSAAVLER